MAPHFVLFEHAAGYALFKLKEFEEVATFLPQVEESVLDVSKFSQVSLSSSLSCSKRLSIKEVQRLTEASVSDPDSIRSDPGGQKRLQK
jgi:hypothetical protein